MDVKNRILLMKEYLEENSDEEQAVSTPELIQYLKKKGCPVTVQTLRTDIRSLQKAGYDIEITEKEGMPTTYSWITRKWDEPELQILVDAVSSSQFITRKKSNELIRKLAGLAGPSTRKDLQPRILVSENIKAPNEQILYIVSGIRDAIRKDRKISFRYFHYDSEKKRVPTHEGTSEKRHIVSPYAMIWNDDRYYLVGWSDTRQDVTTYRIDRMETLKLLAKKRVPAPEDFCVQDYSDRIFSMYNGPQEEVTLRCRHSIMDQVIDKFGEQIKIENIQKDTFDITVPVSISGTFYGWIFQFVGEMNIIEPGYVKDAYADYLQEAIDDVLGT